MIGVVCVAGFPELILGGGSKTGLVLAFLVAAAAIVVAGTKLSAYGDALGRRTGLGSGLVGMVFLAAVTSLPELVVSTSSAISASLKAGAAALQGLSGNGGLAGECDALLNGGADLAVGNMIGSNVFNLMLIVLMDLVQGKGALIRRLSRHHVMAAVASLGMTGALLFGVAVCNRTWGGTPWVIPYLDTGPITPVLVIAYVAAMVLQQRLERRDDGMAGLEAEPDAASPGRLLEMSAFRFYGTILLFAAWIVAGGVWLSVLGDRIAQPVECGGFGLGQSFVGTVFLAISTSLPELVVSVAAVRMGCYNMAVGNVLGSNVFNLVIVFVADIGLRGASILHYAGSAHLVSIGMATMLTCVVVAALVYRSERNVAWLGVEAWVMVAIYALGNAALLFMQ